VVASEFTVDRVLSPTAVVLTHVVKESAEETVVDLWDEFDSLSQSFYAAGSSVGPEVHYERMSWMIYRVLATRIDTPGQSSCFGFRHTVGDGEELATTSMLHPIAWAQVPGYPDYDEELGNAEFTIAMQSPGAAATMVYSAQRRVGQSGDTVQIPLGKFAGSEVEIRFCASLLPRSRSASIHTVAGWAEPRIVRPEQLVGAHADLSAPSERARR